jgi:hypothetical protein
MPTFDVVERCGEELGNHFTCKKIIEWRFYYLCLHVPWQENESSRIILQYNCINWSEDFRAASGQVINVRRPEVFEEYEAHKSKYTCGEQTEFYVPKLLKFQQVRLTLPTTVETIYHHSMTLPLPKDGKCVF